MAPHWLVKYNGNGYTAYLNGEIIEILSGLVSDLMKI